MIKINVSNYAKKDGSNETSESERKQNRGGFLGGLKYLGASIASGPASIFESVIDVAGPMSYLNFNPIGGLVNIGASVNELVKKGQGKDNYWDRAYKENVVGDWHEDITREYNPTGIMKFAGDALQGVGQSSVLLLDLVAPGVGTTLFYTGVMSGGVQSAVEQTGELGLKEVAYGATSGALEATLEKALGAEGAIATSVAKKTGGEAVKSLVSSATRKGFWKTVISSAAEEFLEEAVSEVADTMLLHAYKIDPEKQLSMKDVLYAGAVGALSGGIMSSGTYGINAAVNRSRGEKLIKNGNAQTVVNTANYVADRLAASGTDFSKASEWVRTLRGEVDAYNNLVKQGKGDSANAKTILGEMQASLFFAETQAINAQLVKNIQESSEADRAAMAEYINLNFDKSKRQKDFTAEDIANNTNKITTQLAIMEMAGAKFFNYDAAMADQAMESGVESVIEGERAKAAEKAEAEAAQKAQAETVTESATVEPSPEASMGDAAFEAAQARAATSFEAEAKPVDEEIAPIESAVEEPTYAVSDKLKAAAEKIEIGGKEYKADASELAAISDAFDGYVKSGMSEGEAIRRAVDENLTKVTTIEGGRLVTVQTKDALRRAKKSIISAYNPQVETEVEASKTAQEARKTSEGTEAQTGAEDGAEAKESGKAAEKSSKSKNKSSETKKGEPKVSEAKEALTDEQRAERAERAKKQAERWIEWEKKTAPTAKELNTAREYVKGFDNLNNTRRLAIIRMIRSSEGKVDAKILKGLANLMSITLKADIEIRFAENIGNKGLYTHVGDKALILLDPSANYKDSIQGTIAHELVHYIENKAGYKGFAKYVMSRVKPESRKKVEKLYNDHYTDIYTAEAIKQGLDAEGVKKYVADKMATEEYKALIESEIVAKYVGQALNNEKLLKKYADKDKKFIVKVGDWLVQKVKALKGKEDVDPEAVQLAEDMALRVTVLLQETDTVGESNGETKYTFDGTPEQIAEWKKPITEKDVKVLRTISDQKGQVSINKLTSTEIMMLQKWAYKYWQDPKIKEKSPFFRAWFGEWRMHQTNEFVSIANIPEYVATNEARKQNRGTVTNGDTGWDIRISREGETNTISHAGTEKLSEYGLAGIRGLVENAYLFDTEIHEHHSNNALNDYISFDHKLYALGKNVDGSIGLYKITIEEYYQSKTEPTNRKFHNLKYIEKVADLAGGRTSEKTRSGGSTNGKSTTTYSISDLYGFVKTFDKDFVPAPEVSEYVLNEDGTPKVFYHGTNAKFSMFDSIKSQPGYWFTESKKYAGEHGEKVLSVYLSAKNMLTEDNLWTLAEERFGLNVEEKNIFSKEFRNFLISKKYDGMRFDHSGALTYIVFDATQIKSATDNIGTFDKDNPDIRYDLADDLAEEKAEKKADEKPDDTLNENGEVKDEYFAAAVLRSMNAEAEQSEESRKKRGEEMIKTRKQKFNDLIREAAAVQRKLERLGKVSKDEPNAKKLKKQYSDILVELGSLQRDMREMGYDLNAESRLIEQQRAQIESQKEQIKDLKQQKADLERLEREDKIMRDLERREAARVAKLYAKQRAEFGEVYNEKEIKDAIDDMLERGLINQFFGGQYKPNLSKKQINGIAEYIAMQLNMLGTTEGEKAQNIIFAATSDIVKRITFTDAESGDTLHLDKVADEETVKRFSEFVEADLINMFQNVGTLNPYSELQRRFALVKAEYLDKGKQAKERQEFGKELPKTYQAALKIKKMAAQGKGTFSDSVAEIAKRLGRLVDESGHLHFGMIDQGMKELSTYFEGEAMRLQSEIDARLKKDRAIDENAQESNFDVVEKARLLKLKEDVEQYNRLRAGKEGQTLNAEELKIAGDILRNTKVYIERFNKEMINGHYTDIDAAAYGEVEDLISINKILGGKEYKTKVGQILGQKVGKKLNEIYFYKVLSPEAVLGALESYRDGGLLQSMYHTIRLAQQKSNTMAVRMLKPLAQFIDDKENEWEGTGKDEGGGTKGWKYSYRDKLNVKKVNVYGSEITLGEAINLYMLTKREAAHAGLIEGGYITYDKNGGKHVIKIEDIGRARDFIANQFDKTDLEFLKLAEDFFNKTASEIKYDADMKILGFSNNADGFYVPMVRDRYSRMKGVTDARFSMGEIVTIYSPSFTKNLVANANGLEGQNIMSLIEQHAYGLADYSELYLPLKAFDRLYNRGVSSSEGVTSIREQLNTKVWNVTDKYFRKLFSDIQGQSSGDRDTLDKVVGWVRSNWVNSLLGANPKVIVTQTTSLGAATQMIEPKYITKAAYLTTPGLNVDEVRKRAYEYSDIIEARAFDMGAIKAQGNIEKTTWLGEKTGWGIGWMDERVCLSIFHAAELKVEDQKGYAVGTRENAEMAAKIADETILTTQSMSDAAEKSALQRSKSEIGKTFSVFTSDAVKNLSHLWGNLMKYQAHKARADAGDAKYKEMLKQDKAELGRSVRTLAITGVMLGLITQVFKYLYAKEEEEPEDKAWDLVMDVTSSTLNILPIFSDFIDKIAFDYDISVNVLDVVNDTLETVGKGGKLAGKAMSGEYVSTSEAIETPVNIVSSLLQLLGIPVKPAERTITGLMRRFTPSAIYGYDAMFSNPSYTADLKKAVESGDDALAEHVLEQLYKSEVNGTYTSAEIEEVVRLYSLTDEDGEHYNVLPQKIGKEINGVTLNAAQRKQFKKEYSQASGEVNKLISSSYYTALTDEQRAKAIKKIYSMYYDRAAAEVAGKEWSNAVAYSYLTDNYAALFAAQAYKGGLSEQKDASGKKITVGEQFVAYAKNLGLSESDYVVITYANGVRNKTNKAALIQYLNAMQLSADVKKQIAERLGFEYRDGAVVEKEE